MRWPGNLGWVDVFVDVLKGINLFHGYRAGVGINDGTRPDVEVGYTVCHFGLALHTGLGF